MGTLPLGRSRTSADIADAIAVVRHDTLRRLIWTLAGVFLLWMFGVPLVDNGILGSTAALLQRWVLLLGVAGCLGGAYLLLERRPGLAGPWFVTTAVLVNTGALALFQSPVTVFLSGVIVLAALPLMPYWGALAAGLTSMIGIVVLRGLGALPLLNNDLLAGAGLVLLIAAVVGRALERTIVIAVEWSEHSMAKAGQNADEAQRHRGQIVQTLQQLDDAYYRLRQANAALEMAWKAADTAERAKSEFVTNISHELRTPLNLIVGFSEMIVTSPESYGVPLPAEYRGDLNAIYRSARHLLALTDDVLDLARIGAGRLTLAREPVDLAQAIGDAAAIVRDYVTAKGLRLTVEIAPELPPVILDRLRIRQVLLNLVTNAARFTERGGITISAARGDAHALLKVTDTGKGIAPSDIGRVFEEFHQGETGRPAAGDRPHNYGLGLPISKQLIELHGGTMGVESSLGVGTTFWFTLPLTLVAGGHSDPLRPNDLVWLAGHGERILVLAGADSQLAPLLQRQLRGYRVVIAADPASAQDMALNQRALAILVDADGFDPVRWAGSPAPVIALPLPQPGRLSAGFGVAAYLTKPVQRSELVSAIEKIGRSVQTILVIDDDPQFVRLVQRYLRGNPFASYTVLRAHSGDEALAVALRRPPDLILLDLILPDAGGEEILARLRTDAGLVDTPVIMVSAQEQLAGRLTLGDAFTVVKPDGLRLDELCRAVEALAPSLEPPRRYAPASASESNALDEAGSALTGSEPSQARS